MLMATFRNVLKTARDDGVIDAVPDTPRPKQKDNPRPLGQIERFYARRLPISKDLIENLQSIGDELAEHGRQGLPGC